MFVLMGKSPLYQHIMIKQCNFGVAFSDTTKSPWQKTAAVRLPWHSSVVAWTDAGIYFVGTLGLWFKLAGGWN